MSRTIWPCNYFLCLGLLPVLWGAPKEISFSQQTGTVETFDFIEITVQLAAPEIKNCFTDASVRGSFGQHSETLRTAVEGFCDSVDGSVFRIRFMPSSAGDYAYSVAYRQGSFEKTHVGTFRAVNRHRRGPIRVDPNYPWHFTWEGTGEHYFFNGTTAFWLQGWREERVIDYSIERLHQLKVNRLRVLLAGASNRYWGERLMTGRNFTLLLRPWVTQMPDNFDHPAIDYTRFDVPYWQKWERMLHFARDRDVIISVILDISIHKAQPAAYSEDERRYIRYAVARLSAFSNMTYDLGDDLDSYRDEKWAHETGTLIESWDPYKHLATSHPVHREHQDRASAWFGFTSIQEWSRRQHPLMLEERQIQLKTGRIIPQTNEEYGYEDHYPGVGLALGSDSAESLRSTAWDIAMAGAYGTTGESCRLGTNVSPDMGGGWVNGRGDDTMVMLKGYEHMVDFFTSFEWWKTEPHDELVNNGNYCLAKSGGTYAVYLPKGGNVTIKLNPGRYEATWFNAFTGERVPMPPAEGPVWTSPKVPAGGLDWASLLRRR